MPVEILNEEELDYLDQLLQSYGGEESILDVNELDGFMTALVVAPTDTPMTKWYPAIWGGVDNEPELDSEEEAEQLEELLLHMKDSLRSQLMQDPESFTALFYEGEFVAEDSSAPQTITVVEEWCFGFMRGWKTAGYPDLQADQDSFLQAIALHGDEACFPKLEAMTLDAHQESISDIEPAVRKLFTHFHS